LAAIDQVAKLSILDKLLYRFAFIPATKKALLKQKADFAWTNTRPDWGRGRIDPFNPVKVAILANVNPQVSIGNTIGNADMVPIWNMRPREGMAYHWDGLNTDLTEVVRSSAIGDGATPKSIPLKDLQRLQNWLMDLQPPKYPFLDTVDKELASHGEGIYQEHCASCHAFGGEKTGQVLPVSEVGTDPHRAEMWTPDAAQAYNDYSKGYPWAFHHFRSTGGYVNVPLDAVWIRAPYLHNGSVPTIEAVLNSKLRPTYWTRGFTQRTASGDSSKYDYEKLGWQFQTLQAADNKYTYNTTLPGYGNYGHTFGDDLSEAERLAVIEYLKTL